MKYFLFSIITVVLFSSSIKEPLSNGNTTNLFPIDYRYSCEITCSGRGLTCLGVLDKTVYDGKTEKSKVLSKETISFCLQYPEESNPT